MGLGALIVQLVGGAVMIILGVATMGPSILTLLAGGPDMATLAVLGGMSVFALASLVLGVVAAGLVYAGLIGSVVAYRRGEEVSLSTFWSYARQYFGKMILLGIIIAVIMLVSAILLIIPILGWLVWFVWVPVASVTLSIYPAYLVINDGYSVGDALSTGFRVLRSMFVEALIGGVILLVFGLVLGLIGSVPLLGWIVVMLFGEPLLLFVLTERFETEVRPRLAA
nr:hypothetical protein [Symbiobacterium terraclitae]